MRQRLTRDATRSCWCRHDPFDGRTIKGVQDSSVVVQVPVPQFNMDPKLTTLLLVCALPAALCWSEDCITKSVGFGVDATGGTEGNIQLGVKSCEVVRTVLGLL